MTRDESGSGGSLPGHPLRSRSGDELDGPGEVGEEPDPRFTFANERTFLAWNRTALALVAAGAAAAAFLRSGLSGARFAIALPLIGLGAVVSLTSYRRWDRVERALRRREPIPYTPMMKVLGIAVAVLAVLAAALALIDSAVS